MDDVKFLDTLADRYSGSSTKKLLHSIARKLETFEQGEKPGGWITLRQRMQAAEAAVVSGFYENGKPEFTQGMPTHELQFVLTAEEVNALVNKISELAQRLVEAQQSIKVYETIGYVAVHELGEALTIAWQEIERLKRRVRATELAHAEGDKVIRGECDRIRIELEKARKSTPSSSHGFGR